jgi:hypothetical protein
MRVYRLNFAPEKSFTQSHVYSLGLRPEVVDAFFFKRETPSKTFNSVRHTKLNSTGS